MYKRFLKVLFLRLIHLVLSTFHFANGKCGIALGERNLTEHPKSVMAVLNCTFYGRSVDTVNWTRNKQPVKDENILEDSRKTKKWSAVVLYTNSTSVQDADEFTCEAKRGQDYLASCSVHPTKPKLDKLPSIKIALKGSVPELGCRGKGWPTPRVSWWRHGSMIHDGDYHHSYMLRYRSGNLLSMKILSLVAYHHGVYTCRADNLFGTSKEYVNIMVKREDMIKNDYIEQQAIVAIEGRNTSLKCICFREECFEKTAITYWKHNGSHVNTSQKFILSKEDSNNGVKIMMKILNVSQTDRGVYYCGIKTSKGFTEIPRLLHILTSGSVPQISATLNAVSGVLLSPVWLRCKATYPAILTAPKTFWVFNNTGISKESQHYRSKEYGPRIGPNSTFKVISLELHISNVSSQDVGWYTCGVDFSIDVVKASIFFSLKGGTSRGNLDDPNTDSSSEDSPLVAISSITAGGIIMGFVAAFVAYRLCRNKRNAEEPVTL